MPTATSDISCPYSASVSTSMSGCLYEFSQARPRLSPQPGKPTGRESDELREDIRLVLRDLGV